MTSEQQEIASLVLNVLSVIGGSGLVAALVPLKFRQYIPILFKIIDFLGANFLGAKNATADQIEQQKADGEAKKAVRVFGKSRKR